MKTKSRMIRARRMVELRVLVGEEMLPILDAGVQKGKPGQVGSQGPGSSSTQQYSSSSSSGNTPQCIIFFPSLWDMDNNQAVALFLHFARYHHVFSSAPLFKSQVLPRFPRPGRQNRYILQVSLLSNPRRDGNRMPSYLHTAQKPSQFTSANSPWSPVALLYYKG